LLAASQSPLRIQANLAANVDLALLEEALHIGAR
jgi:hypothetical protein